MRTAVFAAAVAVLALTACAEKSKRPLAYPPVEGRTPSLVFDSPQVEELRFQALDRYTPELPWYDNRLDSGPFAFRGYETPAVRAMTVWSHDQQWQTDGRVHTHFRQTSRYIELQEQVR